jgi:hypothetical protein
VIRLRLFPQGLDEVKSFAAVSMFAVEDFPFQGRLGEIDRLLESEASRLVQQGKLSGAWESQALLASKGRLAPEYVLFAGLGSLEDLTLTKLYRRAKEIFRRMMKASAKNLSMQVSGFAQLPDDFAPVATEIMNGAIRGVIGNPWDVDILVCEPNDEKYDELIALSEQIAFSSVKNRELSLEVLI